MRGLTLETWREILQYHPWHFWQWSNATVPLVAECSTLVREYGWQDADRAGRDQIRTAIIRAEQLMRQYANFWPTPRPFQETRLYPAEPFWDQWPRVVLEEKHLQTLGTEQESGASTVTPVYTDADGDGLLDTATLTATVPAGTPPDELVVRFLAVDCSPITPPELPIRDAVIVGTTATITINAWCCAQPIRYQGVGRTALNPATITLYAASLEVLRRRCDPTGTSAATCMITLDYDTNPAPWASGCCTNPANPASTDPAATATVLARGTILDSRAGVISFGEAVYTPATGAWTSPFACGLDWRCWPPNRVTVNGYAGYPRDGLAVGGGWALVLARLAAAELARPICACTSANKELYEWQTDLSRTGATNELFAAPGDMTNPLGSRRGQIYAWRSLQREQVTTGIYAG